MRHLPSAWGTLAEIARLDPDTYALVVNIARRHLTKGQCAMVVATTTGLPQTSTRKVAAEVGVSAARVSQANVVRDFRPDLADDVISGGAVH